MRWAIKHQRFRCSLTVKMNSDDRRKGFIKHVRKASAIAQQAGLTLKIIDTNPSKTGAAANTEKRMLAKMIN